MLRVSTAVPVTFLPVGVMLTVSVKVPSVPSVSATWRSSLSLPCSLKTVIERFAVPDRLDVSGSICSRTMIVPVNLEVSSPRVPVPLARIVILTLPTPAVCVIWLPGVVPIRRVLR